MTAPKDPENSCVIRGRSLTRSKHNINYLHMHIAPTVSCRSFLTTDTIPRSLSPSSRTSIYAASVQKAHQIRLESPLSNIEGLSEYPEVRCVVTSMPYTNSKRGLSGHYSGMMDLASKLPDGEGILCCHDGRVLDGEWRLGEFEVFCPITARRPRDSDSSFPCDISTCSSLSASVTRHYWRDVDKTKTIKVPKNFCIVTHSHHGVIKGTSNGRRSPPTRMASRGSVSEHTEKTSPLSPIDSIDNSKLENEAKRALNPFSLVSKVKMSMNTIRRRM
ncbi:hypothetical protein ACHAW6_005241 [Cyclotella cf. meneghiniana]